LIASWTYACGGDLDPAACERLSAIAGHMATHADLDVLVGVMCAFPAVAVLLLVLGGRRR
jgi:hypothetical protein